MKALKSAALLGALALSALSLSACTEDMNASAGGEQSTEVKAVGLMVQDLGNPFFNSMKNGVEAAAKDLGATFSAQDGRQDLAAQNDQIDAFIQQGIDVLLINAVDSEGVGPAVQRARDAGITVVAVDVGAKNAEATVTTDNVQAGRLACESLIEQIGGKGEILIVDGTPTTSIQDRVTGCEEALAAAPDVKVVGQQNGDNGREKALTLTTDMLTASPNIAGIFGVNDPTALGANLAAQQAGKTDLIITGVDGSPEAVAEMGKGTSMFKGTAAQDPNLLGSTALEMAVKLRAGETLEEDTVLVPSSLVDAANLSSYKGWK
ncbi:ABC transporter substrate-binding protein [Arthrobacter sunyaminii]|uniref:ABC transporter substrate-binding protein n=1 Tax=Arthrobacter sunyaminii TaxID=2816859 RepID=A0A975S6V2_9MICC|nr:ABC transporter substrate-binding protein [Arthrobacter sunyaminii]MBO0907844.1 ABC transporter substrate-binding protein [Arthrobacter sunyaminii]QWQ36900.1 ABC transporter substrate-binding protein [Arthrobacter sunyaminii]